MLMHRSPSTVVVETSPLEVAQHVDVPQLRRAHRVRSTSSVHLPSYLQDRQIYLVCPRALSTCTVHLVRDRSTLRGTGLALPTCAVYLIETGLRCAGQVYLGRLIMR